MSLIALRHTRPSIQEGVCYGRTDLPLHGDIDQAFASVSDRLPVFQTIFSSSLSRCALLAEYLACQHQKHLCFDDRLLEMDFGCWEAISWDHIPRHELDAWAENFEHARPHGGESVAMLETRVRSFLTDIEGLSDTPLIITHAGVIRAMLAIAGAPDAWQTNIPFGEFVEISLPDGESA